MFYFHNYFLWKSIFVICSKGGLSLLKGGQAEEQKAIVLEDHWKWDYDVKAVLKDNSGTSINVQFTTSCAEVSSSFCNSSNTINCIHSTYTYTCLYKPGISG